MATRLRKLRLTRIDRVDKGAQPDAYVRLVKLRGQDTSVGRSRNVMIRKNTTEVELTREHVHKAIGDEAAHRGVDADVIYREHPGLAAALKVLPPGDREQARRDQLNQVDVISATATII
jgi:hypothetical protein